MEIDEEVIKSFEAKVDKLQRKIIEYQTLLDAKDLQLSLLNKELSVNKKLNKNSELVAFRVVPAQIQYTNENGISNNVKMGTIMVMTEDKYNYWKQKTGKYTSGLDRLDEDVIKKVELFIDVE